MTIRANFLVEAHMTADQFAYWLQGFAELNGESPSAEQWQVIRDHLAPVFNKVKPNLYSGSSFAIAAPTTGSATLR